MDLNKVIAKRVLSKMKQRKISRQTLADSVPADKYKLDNYLQGKAKWDINYLVRICEILNVSINELIDVDYSKANIAAEQRTHVYSAKKKSA